MSVELTSHYCILEWCITQSQDMALKPDGFSLHDIAIGPGKRDRAEEQGCPLGGEQLRKELGPQLG